jgi:hypothetical protein
MKKLVYLIILAGIGFFFNGCATSYVTYQEFARPARPSNAHVWINGDWVFDKQANSYVQKTGYWERPVNDRKFVPGHWQSTPRGHHWEPGYWVSQL